MNIRKKLETFSKITEEEAVERRKEIQKDVGEKLTISLEACRKEATEAAALKINGKKQEAARFIDKEVSIYKTDMKKKLYDQRLILENALFDRVLNRLRAYTATKEYIYWLNECIQAALDAHEACEVVVTQADYDKIAISRSFERITISEEDFLGGYRVLLKQSKIIMDHTYQSKLNDWRENFTGLRASV